MTKHKTSHLVGKFGEIFVNDLFPYPLLRRKQGYDIRLPQVGEPPVFLEIKSARPTEYKPGKFVWQFNIWPRAQKIWASYYFFVCLGNDWKVKRVYMVPNEHDWQKKHTLRLGKKKMEEWERYRLI